MPFHYYVLNQLANKLIRTTDYELLRLSESTKEALREALAVLAQVLETSIEDVKDLCRVAIK